MSLKVAETAYSVIVELRSLMPRIKRADRSLADQLLRAANSMVLNVGEAQYSEWLGALVRRSCGVVERPRAAERFITLGD